MDEASLSQVIVFADFVFQFVKKAAGCDEVLLCAVVIPPVYRTDTKGTVADYLTAQAQGFFPGGIFCCEQGMCPLGYVVKILGGFLLFQSRSPAGVLPVLRLSGQSPH